MRRLQAPYLTCVSVLAAAFAAAPQMASSYELAKAVDPVDAPAVAPVTPADDGDEIARKIHAQLRAQPGSDAARLPMVLAGEERVLVELRFSPGAGAQRAEQVLLLAAAEIRNVLAADRVEASIPRDKLYELARDSDVVSIVPARLVRPLIGSKTSEGVAAGRANLWQTAVPALNGSGVVIAMIDSFDNNGNEVNSLQATQDWPPDARISLLDYKTFATPPPQCSPTTFGCMNVRHGNATLEIAYDVATGANFRAYDTVTVGDWRRAILDAANLNSSGGSAGAVRAPIISASLGAPLDGRGDGTALPGSIAEAAGWARNRGVLVVNAAGNEREQHWGGLFSLASSGSGLHSWSGSSTLYNAFGVGPGAGDAYCIPAGELIQVDLYWDAWTSPGSNRNYDLYLYRRINSTTWESLPAAQSTLLQVGASGQTPQEQISYVASGTTSGCAANSAVYGVAVVRVAGTSTATTNLQLFANFPLGYRTAARSLGFPADSPNVFSVGAINVATAGSNPQQPFSSEGPVLASGGGLPASSPASDPNLKPDVASYDNVATVSYGTTNFTGTSAAAPHVAGMAALLMQRNGIPTTAAQLDTLILTPLRTLAATGSNDLGSSGRDYQYGYGRLRFQRENVLAFQQQPVNTAVNSVITPAVKVRVLDDEGLLVPNGVLAASSIAIGNDPNSGAAVLSNGGSSSFVQGVATWSNLRIDLGGNAYTLRASAGALPAVTSSSFNITTGAPSVLAFAQHPVTTQAGTTLPAITVRVQDSSGNLVTTDNATQVQLSRSNCTASPVQGGAPVTVVNGVATFSHVVLYTPGTGLRLTASAPGRSSSNSNTFGINANSDFIFRSQFDACLP